MKSKLRIIAPLALVAPWVFAVACAAGDPPLDASPDDGIDTLDGSNADSPTGQGDAESADANTSDASDKADASLPCSTDGWCRTRVPTNDLVFRDIWPLENHAFATADLGDKTAILEYQDAAWSVLYLPSTATTAIWAASPDDVWVGTTSGSVLHGVRHGAQWTWSQDDLADANPPPDPDASPDTALTGVGRIDALWGSGVDDLYAAATALPREEGAPPSARLYHRGTVDGGSPAWRLVLREEESVTFNAVVGTSADDVWVLGTRSEYNVYAARKSADGFVPVIDGTIRRLACAARAPAITCAIGGVLSAFTARAGEVVALIDQKRTSGVPRLMRFGEVATDPDAGVNITTIPGPFPFEARVTTWGSSAEDVFVAGPAQVFRTVDPWADAGDGLDAGNPFAISSVALNGAPMVWQFNVIRGRSADDVWVLGAFHALHKTGAKP